MASGDVRVFETVKGNLTAGEVTALRNLILRLWAGPIANVEEVHFYRSNGTVQVEIGGVNEYAPANVPNVPGLVLRGRVP